MKSETAYQADLITRLERDLPGCFVLKNDAKDRQGIPDLLVIYGPYWAMLEVKKHRDANLRPNQAFYIEYFSEIGFAAFVYPENEEEVINALQSTFGIRR
jgi:hypothetical protein